MKQSNIVNIFSEAELQARDVLHSIFSQQDYAVVLTDFQGAVIFCNLKFNELHHQISFPQLLEVHHPASWEVFAPHNTSDIKIFLSHIEREKKKYFLWIISQDHDFSGSILSKMAILKNLYRSFIDTTFEMVVRTNDEGKFLYANRLFLSTLQFKNYRSIKNESIETVFAQPEQWAQMVKSLRENGEIKNFRAFFKNIKGEQLTCMINATLHNHPAEKKVINWAMLNVTHQLESEQELKHRNDQLAKINHQMEKFLYSTSHDLRAPLTTILGLVNLMRMEDHNPSMVDLIAKVESSTLKLDKIIKDIITFSKTTYQRSSSEKLDFETIVWKAINQHKSDVNLRRINFDVRVEGSFPFFNDLDRVEIVVDNIIRNAVNFYDGNKSRPFIKVTITVTKDQAILEFMDNGIGIGKQHHENIFLMFYKASHISKGAGLGLFIVKETLEKIKGTISIESEVGFGTVVRVTIPNDHKGRLMSRKLQLQSKTSLE